MEKSSKHNRVLIFRVFIAPPTPFRDTIYSITNHCQLHFVSCLHSFDMSACGPSPDHIMQIPEVLFNVGYFLNTDSLTSSVRVCKLWRDVLEPFLYRNIHQNLLPPIEALQRHLYHIQTLHLERHDLEFTEDGRVQQLYQCRNLKELNLSLHDWEHRDDNPELDLVVANRMLLKLKIEDKTILSRRPWGRILAESSPVLQELSLTKVHLDEDATKNLLKIAQSLTELVFNGCILATLDVKFAPQFTNIKTLLLKGVFDSPLQELEWIGHCPRLENLYWVNHWRDSTGTFFQKIKLLRWPRLTGLHLVHGSYPFGDIEIAAMLDACDQLRVVFVNQSLFWYRSLKSLERHLSSLDVLSLPGCLGVKSWMCHWILARSPKLRTFSAEYILAHELIVGCPLAKAILNQEALVVDYTENCDLIEEDKEILVGPEYQETRDELENTIADFEAVRLNVHIEPWVCLDLEEFRCCITHRAAWSSKKLKRLERTTGRRPLISKEWDSQILCRFSKLTKLKHWDISINQHAPTDQVYKLAPGWRGLGLSLKSGLAQLDTLHCLEDLRFAGTTQNLGEEDCQWMLDHWPLESISSDFNEDDGIRKELAEMMGHLNLITRW